MAAALGDFLSSFLVWVYFLCLALDLSFKYFFHILRCSRDRVSGFREGRQFVTLTIGMKRYISVSQLHRGLSCSLEDICLFLRRLISHDKYMITFAQRIAILYATRSRCYITEKEVYQRMMCQLCYPSMLVDVLGELAISQCFQENVLRIFFSWHGLFVPFWLRIIEIAADYELSSTKFFIKGNL